GSYVYYVANGVLAPHAGSGHCEPREAPEHEAEQQGTLPVESCSLYVAHFNGTGWETKYLATLSTEDQNAWHFSLLVGVLGAVTSRVSPNGLHLAFMSNRSLTGYNNDDVNLGKRDEEVFLYNFPDEVKCVSCKASG